MQNEPDFGPPNAEFGRVDDRWRAPHMMIGLCEVNWGGCHEGERNALMPALTLGRGVEQNFQRVKRNPDKRPDWNLVPRAGAAGRPATRQRHKERRTKPIWNRSKA